MVAAITSFSVCFLLVLAVDLLTAAGGDVHGASSLGCRTGPCS
jgi:hypothetical protein